MGEKLAYDYQPGSETIPVLLVGVNLGQSFFDVELAELGELAKTAGLMPVERVVCKRQVPDAALFVGSGKADEIRELVAANRIKEVLFDQSLSPAQQRNLERVLGVPVTDRTMLILEIFSQRARSHEGKLQVELARLQYLSTRLVRRWSHLERQRGGIGNRGGPGETQIELDKRMIGESIRRTRDKLERYRKQRSTQNRRRERNQVFRISLVGYTNAGKSTLFNALVKAGSYAADQLFATLDTTTRQMYFQDVGRAASISDTVGFIRDLPHGLVLAFAATLAEVAEADLLLHVIDASSPQWVEQVEQVQKVLKDISADGVPQLLVFNKTDRLGLDQYPVSLVDHYAVDGETRPRVFVSAVNGLGIDALRNLLADRLANFGGGVQGSAFVNDDPDTEFPKHHEVHTGLGTIGASS
jgi:GTPase